jgi:hypothetical protein
MIGSIKNVAIIGRLIISNKSSRNLELEIVINLGAIQYRKAMMLRMKIVFSSLVFCMSLN